MGNNIYGMHVYNVMYINIKGAYVSGVTVCIPYLQ